MVAPYYPGVGIMTSLSKVKAKVIVFDQGNTLLMDPFSSVLAMQKDRFHRLCEIRGVSASSQQIAYQWMKSNKEVNYPHIGHFCQEEPIVQHALRNLNVIEDTAAILGLELLREYRIGLREVIESDPRTQEVQSTLNALRTMGKRLGIFSNDRTVALGFVLNVMRVKEYFSYLETSESLGFEKPDPRVFEHIVHFFGVEPSTVIYVGDDPLRDVEAAKAKGLRAIQYYVDVNRYQESWRDYRTKGRYEADVVIHKFSELLDIIQ